MLKARFVDIQGDLFARLDDAMHCTRDIQIRLYNRRTQAYETELVCGRRWIELTYGTAGGRMLAQGLLCRPAFSKLYGRLQGCAASRKRIPAFVARYGIDLSEAEMPAGGYRSFNDFFIRRLKPTARPVETDPQRLIAPADSRLQVFTIREHTWINIKGAKVTLSRMLGLSRLESAFEGGLALVFRLAPCDYHRFGYITAGRHDAVRALGGPLHSVNPLALAYRPDIHFTNQRHWCHIESALLGNVLQVEVGAMLVGSIVQHQPRGGWCNRGQEKGFFQFGGSTVIVVLEPRRVQVDADIRDHSARGIETLVRYGEAVGTLV